LRNFASPGATPREIDTELDSIDGEREAMWQCDTGCVGVVRLHFREASSARVFARWFGESVGLNSNGVSGHCLHVGEWAISFQWHIQDMAIASVNRCHGMTVRGAVDFCRAAADIAGQMADFGL